MRGEDGRLYHWILPSFFQLLADLGQEGRDFAVVFRTFGTDLPRALRAVCRAVSEGAHPLFPDLSDLSVSPAWRPGREQEASGRPPPCLVFSALPVLSNAAFSGLS